LYSSIKILIKAIVYVGVDGIHPAWDEVWWQLLVNMITNLFHKRQEIP
jgi:hypothetical protein